MVVFLTPKLKQKCYKLSGSLKMSELIEKESSSNLILDFYDFEGVGG
jgi:hypothetical protein